MKNRFEVKIRNGRPTLLNRRVGIKNVQVVEEEQPKKKAKKVKKGKKKDV